MKVTFIPGPLFEQKKTESQTLLVKKVITAYEQEKQKQAK